MQLIHSLLVALLSVTNLSVQGLSIQSPDHQSQVQVIQAYLEDVQPQVTTSSEYSNDQRVCLFYETYVVQKYHLLLQFFIH